MTLHTVRTVSELLNLSKSIEETAWRVQRFCPPPTNTRQLLEPELAYQLRDRIQVIDALVIPTLPHSIILGVDFWKRMEVVPNLHAGEWNFCSDISVQSAEVAGIQDNSSLTPEQRALLDSVVNEAFDKMGDRVGRTHLVEHVIRTDSPPIKQRYYPLSPTLQQVVNQELDEMLEKGVVEPSTSPWSSPVVMSGLLVDPDKVQAILDLQPPKNVTEVRRIVGLVSWYRRYIPSFSTVVAPLTRLTQKGQPFAWDSACDAALDHLKQTLVSAPILTCPDFSLPFFVETDASDYGLGAVLTQKQNGEDKVICYLSRSLTKSERKYTRVTPRYEQLTDEHEQWKEVVPKERRTSVIKDHHDPPLSGHLGTFKTHARVAAKYYWPKMKADVARYVTRCTACLRTKPEQRKPAGQMLSNAPSITRPWQVLSVDLVGPLPRSGPGHKYILSVLDLFSKFVMLFPLRTATAAAIRRYLEEQVFLVFGVPSRIITDNGSNFTSHCITELCKKYDVEHRRTANYHAQANPVERTHRVIKTALTAYVADNQRKWDTLLPQVAAAIRSAKHETTQLTPNFIVFGREVALSGKDHHQSPDDFQPVVRHEALKEVFRDVQRRLKRAYELRKHTYNLRHRPDVFRLNQQVWKRAYNQSDAVKGITSGLCPKFEGPFRIGNVVSPWAYELIDATGRNRGVWAAKDLKAHPPDSDDDEAGESDSD
nr:unnamed protein product [Callosobruchus analis]